MCKSTEQRGRDTSKLILPCKMGKQHEKEDFGGCLSDEEGDICEEITNDRKGLEKMLVTCGFKSCTGIYEKVADPRIVATRKWLIKP